MVCVGIDIVYGLVTYLIFMMPFDSPNFLVSMVCELSILVPEREIQIVSERPPLRHVFVTDNISNILFFTFLAFWQMVLKREKILLGLSVRLCVSNDGLLKWL
jgi:hypothetical protein